MKVLKGGVSLKVKKSERWVSLGNWEEKKGGGVELSRTSMALPYTGLHPADYACAEEVEGIEGILEMTSVQSRI